MMGEMHTQVAQLCGNCAQIDSYRQTIHAEMMGRGDVCVSCGYAPRDAREMAADQLRRSAYRALDAGATHAEVGEVFAEVLDTLPPYERIPATLILWPESW